MVRKINSDKPWTKYGQEFIPFVVYLTPEERRL